EAYLRYLRAAGNEAGTFLLGSDPKVGGLGTLKASAQAPPGGGKGPRPPGGAVRFCCPPGNPFLFFRLNTLADPLVECYLEGERDFRVVAPSFSSWLLQAAMDEFPD